MKDKEFFPADLVLLKSSQKKNICYIETKGLDGETNLKEKLAPKAVFDTYKELPALESELKGSIKCECPND